MTDLTRLLQDLYCRIPWVDPDSGFDLSPDGKRIVFAWNPTGIWEIYETNLDGSSEPRQVSHGVGAKFNPQYSPEGQRLAYMLDPDGSENYHMILHDLRDDQYVDVTPVHVDGLRLNYDWSPRGDQIALIFRQSELQSRDDVAQAIACTNVGILSLKSGDLTPILIHESPAWQVKWSPDGAWLAICVETQGQDYGVFLVPAEGHPGEKTVRTISWENSPLDAQDAAWSPESDRLVFHSNTLGNYNLAVYHLATDKITWLTSRAHSAGKGEMMQAAWSPDGQTLVYTHHKGASCQLGLLSPDRQTTELDLPLPGCEIIPENLVRGHHPEKGIYSLPQFLTNGRQVCFLYSSPQHPPDLWQLELDSAILQQLTHSLTGQYDLTHFPIPEEITYPGLDQTPIPALLYLPTDKVDRSPAVVVIHGGPNWLFQMTWNPMLTALVSRGWIVLAPNYRGSTGYGRDWQMANRYEMGGVDAQDVAAGAIYLCEQGLADAEKIAVTGRSHGGYLTMVCLTQYPHLWAGGSAVAPFLNWFTSHANARADIKHWDIENMGDPQDNYELWCERSPYFFLDRIQSPVQLICGAHDPYCPASEALAGRDRLIELGKSVDCIVYPDEGHTFLKIENILDAEQRRIEFLGDILSPR